MQYILCFFCEIVVLYILSRYVARKLFNLTPLFVYQILFLPGIFVHELSHLIAAKIFGVKVTKFSVLPKRDGNSIILGQVEIEKSGPVRNAIVSIAPTIVGVSTIIAASYLLLPNFNNIYIATIYVFILFELIHTMFISRQDVKVGWVGVLGVVLTIGLSLVWGIRIGINWGYFPETFARVNDFLAIAIGLDIVLMTIFELFKILKNSLH